VDFLVQGQWWRN